MVKLIPNILTFIRLVLSMVFLVMVTYSPRVENSSQVLDIAFVIFVVAGITDIADGIVARRFNVTSKFGRMTDPLFDKVLVGGTFVCFALIGEPKLFELPARTLAVIHWVVAGIIISRVIYVTILRHVAEARGINFAATPSGKIKMFLQCFAIGTVVIKMGHVQTAEWGYWFTSIAYAVMLVVTIVSGFLATQREGWKEASQKGRYV